MQNRIKLIVIDDSTIYHSWFIENLEKDPRFEIVGCVVNAFDAENRIPVLKPGILTPDIEMSGMSGLDFLKEYPPSHPIPVTLVPPPNVRVFDALVAGAVDSVRKPDMDSHALKKAFLSMLMTRLTAAAASRVHVPPAAPASPPSVKMPALKTSFSTELAACRDMVIAIGASTGGTETILEVLKQFPGGMPGVVITQRMPAGLTAMYVERLNRLCKMEVREAKNGDRLRPGLVLLTPDGPQIRVVRMRNGYTINCVHGGKASGHCPSVSVLSDTVSSVMRGKVMGVLLAGMGVDGAAGLLRIRKNGAYTIGQNQDTRVVCGMPMETYKIGVVC